ncbi:MAG: serine/threonine protein kinase [Candidatus Schekmanbacteria bacterium]|nr:serine/threonine protein kinase [Candidatus Schekmanbacteria bacterium]
MDESTGLPTGPMPRQVSLPHEAYAHQAAELQRHLGQRYTFLALLGKGGGGAVFRVRNVRLHRDEALKILTSDHEPDSAERFEREATIAAALDHPNIVKIYDFGRDAGLLWYVMQLIEGPTLGGVLRVAGRLDPLTVCQLAIPILGALQYSHDRGVIHRDIKPANVILDPSGRPHLADFGVARSTESTVKTQTGFMMGTPAYVAPEQAIGGAIDGRADLYALGVTLFEALTGARPFQSQSVLEMVMKRLVEPAPRIEEMRPDLEPELADLVMRSLARAPEQRHESALAMRDGFAAYLESRGLSRTRWQPLPEFSAALATASKVTRAQQQPVGFTATATPAALSTAETAPPDTLVARTPEAPLVLPPPLPLVAGSASRSTNRAAIVVAASLGAMVIAATTAAVWIVATEQPPAAAVATTAPTGPRPALASAETALPAAPAPSPSPSPTTTAIPTTTPPEPTATRPAPSPRATAIKPAPQPTAAARVAPRPAARPVTTPVPITAPLPDIPPDLVAACAGTRVGVVARVDVTGATSGCKVLQAGNSACGPLAVAACSRYKFSPARDAEGQPVAVTVAIGIDFPAGASP